MSESTLQPALKRSGAVLVFLVLAVVFAIGYSLHQRSIAQQLSAQNAQLNASLQQTKSELADVTTKVNLLSMPSPAPAPENKPSASVRAHSVRSTSAHRAARRADDPRWKKFQSQLDEQGKAIESTRSDLASAKTELSGSIARTHDELVVLQKKGERNYYEFDLDKAKSFSRQGPFGLRRKKASTKNQYADLELMVDDTKLSQKHVNLLQPVIFYAGENGQAVEMVINRISKNHIHGYVSEPKYKHSELAAMTPAGTADAGQAPAAPNASSRRKLSLPK